MEEKLEELRVVVDTNIYISFLKRGYYRKILELWLEERFELLTSNEIMEELFEVLSRPKFNFSPDEIAELGELLYEKAIVIEPEKELNVCRDPDDNKFLECAVEGKANYLVTGDPDLKDIGEYERIKFVSGSFFLREVI
ncbi:putative toxin-antitoxin system toxin component, PIN family [bacterium]|nr:putative toxin-antitoxin system toxin component, PIN family [bacterium]